MKANSFRAEFIGSYFFFSCSRRFLGKRRMSESAIDHFGPATNREFDKALQSVQSALQGSPNNPQLWMLQGLAYSGTGDSKSALASYQHALKISPDYLPALEGAAQIEYEAGSADAIPLLEHVLKIRPNDVTSHAMMAVLAEKNGDCATAVNHFSKSGPMLDSQPEALQGYGVCLLELKQTDEAIRSFSATDDIATE